MNLDILLQQTLTIGPVNIPAIFIPLFSGWIIYQILIKRFYKERPEHLQRVDRLLFNGLFIILVVWKLSPIVFQFSTVISNPLAALYLPGGIAGVILGLIIAGVFFTVSILKQKDSRKAVFKSLAFNFWMLLCLIIVLSFATTMIYKQFGEQAESPAAITGVAAPGFILEGEDGLSYRLSDYKDKIVVINFWANWCPPCRAELPELKKFYDELAAGEVVFLSINLYTSERDPAGLPDFIKDEGLSFPVLYDKTGKVAEDYRVESIPTTVIIGSDGLVYDVKRGAVTNSWLKLAVRQ